MATDDDEYICDCWPKMPNGKDFDGSDLLNLVRKGSSPFKDNWDVNKLLQEIEAHMHAKVVDIPHVSSGSNNMVSCSPSHQALLSLPELMQL